MTGPGEDRTVEQPAVAPPTVSTAPPPSRTQRWWSSIPSHVGPARTSTVVLAVLFLALGMLYLTVRPDETGNAGRSTPATTTPATTTTAPPTTEPPTVTETEEPAPTTTEEPTSTTEETATTTVPSEEPEETATEEPTETAEPTTEAPTTTPPATSSTSPIG